MGQINVEDGKERDQKSFYNFFYDPYHSKIWGDVKEGLKRKYPDLERKLHNKDKKQGEKIIYDFIDELHDKHSQTIEIILKKFEKQIVNRTDEIFSAMSKTMNYDMDDLTYTLSPSFNFGSTYGESSARLSIVNEIPNLNPERKYLNVFLHEMTHSIWERKIFDIYEQLKLKVTEKDEIGFETSHRNNCSYLVSGTVHNNLKEIATPIILGNKEFENLVEGEDWKTPNPKENYLNIIYNDKEYNLTEFLRTVHNNIKSKNQNFDVFMKVSTLIMCSIQNELLKKHEISKELNFYNQEASSIKKIDDSDYKDPIKLPEQDNLVKQYLPK